MSIEIGEPHNLKEAAPLMNGLSLLYEKELQLEILSDELQQLVEREIEENKRSAKAVATCEAKAAAQRRHLVELKM
jgi:hypothetical protein